MKQNTNIKHKHKCVANVAFLPVQPIRQRYSPLPLWFVKTGIIASGLNRMKANTFGRASNPL